MATKISSNEYNLVNAILKLENFEECYTLLKDLCTPKELKDLAERLAVAKFLYEGKYSYRKISQITGVSLATIGRVARFLNQENYQGYKRILDKLKNDSKENNIQLNDVCEDVDA